MIRSGSKTVEQNKDRNCVDGLERVGSDMTGPPWRSRMVTHPRLMPRRAYLVHVVLRKADTAPSVPFNYSSPVALFGRAKAGEASLNYTVHPPSCLPDLSTEEALAAKR